MINQGKNVPDKTIVVFNVSQYSKKNQKERMFNLIDKLPKKRDWFTPHFYRCLPLVIGNTYGFVIKSEFSFSAVWNGGASDKDTKLTFEGDSKLIKNSFPRIATHFGSGIVTVDPPFFLRTPPGINLMTINPPNFILPNVTVMTGVVETDNLRRNFTFNLKLQIPNIEVKFPAGVPLAAFIPIPRYFVDSFELKMAEEVFVNEDILDEQTAEQLSATKRKTTDLLNKYGVGRDYFRGVDPYGNPFPDHQSP